MNAARFWNFRMTTLATLLALPNCGDIRSGIVDTAADTEDSTVKKYRVFVTSTQYEGDLGGLAGADAKCLAVATSASLGGTWKAWLSDSSTSAIDRISDKAPWYAIDESTVVVATYATLSSGAGVEIKYDQDGSDISLGGSNFAQVWTGTLSTGIKGTTHCTSWTSNAASGTTATTGRIGTAGSSSSGWTASANVDCNELASLYCFEQ